MSPVFHPITIVRFSLFREKGCYYKKVFQSKFNIKKTIALFWPIIIVSCIGLNQESISANDNLSQRIEIGEDAIKGTNWAILRKDIPIQEQLTETNTVYEIRDDIDLSESAFEVTCNKKISIDGIRYYSSKDAIPLKSLQTIDVPKGCVILNKDRTVILGEGNYTASQAVSVFVANTNSIRCTYTIEGYLTIPSGSTLLFSGGSLNNGTISVDKTIIKTDKPCLNNVGFRGSFYNDEINADWFIWGDQYEDNTRLFTNLAESGQTVFWGQRIYNISAEETVLENNTLFRGAGRTKTDLRFIPSKKTNRFIIGLKARCGLEDLQLSYYGDNIDVDVVRIDRWFGYCNTGANWMLSLKNLRFYHRYYLSYSGKDAINPIGIHFIWTDEDAYRGRYIGQLSPVTGLSYTKDFTNITISGFKYGVFVEAGDSTNTYISGKSVWFNSVKFTDIEIVGPTGFFFKEKNPKHKVIKRFYVENYLYESSPSVTNTIPRLSKYNISVGFAGVVNSLIVNNYDSWDTSHKYCIDGCVIQHNYTIENSCGGSQESGFEYCYSALNEGETDADYLIVRDMSEAFSSVFMKTGSMYNDFYLYNFINTNAYGLDLLPRTLMRNEGGKGIVPAKVQVNNVTDNPYTSKLRINMGDSYGGDFSFYTEQDANELLPVWRYNTGRNIRISSVGMHTFYKDFYGYDNKSVTRIVYYRKPTGLNNEELFPKSIKKYIIVGDVDFTNSSIRPYGDGTIIYFVGGRFIGNDINPRSAGLQLCGDVGYGISGLKSQSSIGVNNYSSNVSSLLKSKTLISFYSSSSTVVPITWDGERWLRLDGYTMCMRSGTSRERPKVSSNADDVNRVTIKDIGMMYFDTSLNKPIYVKAVDENKNAVYWIESDGATAGVNRSGRFTEKPKASDIYIGFKYFCTDRKTPEGVSEGIEIIHKGSNVWVDALGRIVN